MKEDKYIKIIYNSTVVFLIFFGVLFFFTEKKDVSDVEKRSLQQAPKFALNEIKDGRFAKESENFYSDQFPLRDAFLAVNNAIERSYGAFKLNDDDITFISTERSEGGAGDMLVRQKGNLSFNDKVKIFSENNRTPKNPLENESIEEDQKSGVVIRKDQGMEVFYFSKKLSNHYANLLNSFQKSLPNNVRLFNILVPTAIAFYGTDELKTGAHSTIEAINAAYSAMSDKIIKVDSYTSLYRHMDEYIYLRTDHHWNARGAYYSYVSFCKVAGLEPTLLEDMSIKQPGDTFLGTLYSMSGKNPAFKKNPDKAEFIFPKNYGSAKQYCYSNEFLSDPIKIPLLDLDGKAKNHYIRYNGGDSPVSVIIGGKKGAGSVLVIKESYGNAFYPFLMDNYEKVYAVDPRSFKGNIINFINTYHIKDVIVLNYSFTMGNKKWLNGFENLF